ncbi:MAG: hypothetical protein CHACPFDD_00672 [Phycisphaerae bacterium]|nr:hypothetical protein [Phycisphaerae bacterium]
MNDAVEPVPKRAKAARAVGALALVVILAAAWRMTLAAAVPCISRDGVEFCWYAERLGTQGVAHLSSPQTRQHPLFPLLILATQRVARACGAADGPLLWQRCGQGIALASGLTLVIVVALLTRVVVRGLDLTVDADRAAIWAAALAALLPLNAYLSADVMSDPLHAALYLAGLGLLLGRSTAGRTFVAGVLAGLAFLTRPEGAMVALAGAAALLLRWRREGAARHGRWPRSIAALAAGFLLCATPFWIATGRLGSPKKDLFSTRPPAGAAYDASRRPPASERLPAASADLLGVLVTRDVSWLMAGPLALYETARGARVFGLLLALPVLVRLRRRMWAAPLDVPLLAAIGHFALTALLLRRWGYLDPRHTLVVVLLALPFAAMLLDRLSACLADRRRAAAAWVVIAACLLTFGVYARRVPNAQDGYWREAAAWLAEHEPGAASRLLLGGSKEKRLAFYAGMQHQNWPENSPSFETLREHLLHFKPAYFALETGTGDERRGNAELLERLLLDARTGPGLKQIRAQPAPRGGTLHVFRCAF